MLGSHPFYLHVSVFTLSACVHLLIPLTHGHALTPAVPIITDRNEVLAKVIFLHVCVILFTGGGGLPGGGGVSA